jgi:hypothetical protein
MFLEHLADLVAKDSVLALELVSAHLPAMMAMFVPLIFAIPQEDLLVSTPQLPAKMETCALRSSAIQPLVATSLLSLALLPMHATMHLAILPLVANSP